MNWAWKKCLNLSFAVIPAALPVEVVFPETASITVRTYNLANAPTKDVVQASHVAGEIFKEAGIEVHWLSCALSLEEARSNRACEEATGRHDWDVVVSTASITRPGIATDASLGFAFPLARSSQAVVLWERSKKMVESSGVPAGIILGHVMAHELGHLLLHSMEHSRTGIMRSRWGKEEWLRAESGGLLFTTGQAEAMRVEVRARTRGPSVAPVEGDAMAARANLRCAARISLPTETNRLNYA